MNYSFSSRLLIALAGTVATASTASPVFAGSNATGGTTVNTETVVLGGPFNHSGVVGSVGNSTTTATFTGGFVANEIRISGTTTSTNPITFGSEARIFITDPGATTTFLSPIAGPGAAFTSFDFDISQDLAGTFAGGIDPNGTWNFEFIETFSDVAGADAISSNVAISFDEVTPVSDQNGVFDLLGLGTVGSSASTVGEFAVGGLVDSFAFTLTETGRLTAVTDANAGGFVGTDADTELFLLDSTGALVVTDDDGGTGTFSQLSDVLLTAGDYTLVVGAFDTTFDTATNTLTAGASTGDYSLNVSFAAVAVPEPAATAVLAFAGLCLFSRRRR